jgi:hypothetical protein
LNQWWVVGLSSGLAVLGTASQASAGGFELGARLGYGIPTGELTEYVDLSYGISEMVPLQLDLGYRVSPAFSIGGYVMYGVGFAGDSISRVCHQYDDHPGFRASCTAHDVRLGIQVQYHFLPKKTLDPWLGAGLGYEWLEWGTDLSGGGMRTETSVTARGFEIINLQGGLDFKVAPGLALGPFLSFSIGQYSSLNGSCSGDDCDDFTRAGDDPGGNAAHQWLLLGVRGTFVVGDDSAAEQ